MKKLLFFVLISLCFSFTEIKEPVLTPPPSYINIMEDVTSVNTLQNEVQFNNLYGYPTQQMYIMVDETNTGTIKFSVGRNISANATAYTAGARIPVTIQNGVNNLYYQASAINQKFSVSN